MNYLFFIGIIALGWILCFGWGILFRITAGQIIEPYDKLLVDHANNIFTFGLFGSFGIFISSLFGGWVTYIFLGIFGIIVVLGLLRVGMCFFTTLLLMFDKNHKGIADLGSKGKRLDWILFMSMLTEESVMVFLLYQIWLTMG